MRDAGLAHPGDLPELLPTRGALAVHAASAWRKTYDYITRHDFPATAKRSRGADSFCATCFTVSSRPQKALPCKYFYDAIGSALFDEICELDEYYLTRTELQILRTHAPEMAEAIGEDCDLIEFGSGSGLKTRLLLAALRSPRAYLPIDISREHLEKSVRDLARRFRSLRFIPVHADFTAPFSLPDTGDPVARRVVYFPGSTIGNFSPRAALALLTQIAQLVGDGGGLLIGFDLDKDESIVWPAYNDRQGKSAAFNLNLLARINRELAADFDLSAFTHRADYLRARGANGDAPGQREGPGRPRGRPSSSPSARARRFTPKTLTNTPSSTSPGSPRKPASRSRGSGLTANSILRFSI